MLSILSGTQSYAQSIGCPEPLQANQFLDITNMQSELGKAVSWGHINAIMSGSEKYKFSAGKTCTKAQVITYISRAITGHAGDTN